MSTSAAPTTATAPFPLGRLLVLTGAIFVSVSSEFLPTGLLPDMARDLDVSESRVGLLVTIFALTVVVSTAPLAAITHKYSRKWLMVVLLGIFAVANVLAGIAPSYELLVGARILGGLAHGLFWAVTGPYASRLVPRTQLAKAISITNAGGTAAFILGVPVGTALGHALGWRAAFIVMALVVVVFAALVVLYLPPVEHRVPLATGEIATSARKDPTLPGIVIVCLTVVLVVTGYNVFSTYIAPWSIEVAGVVPDLVPVILLVNGIGGALGLALAAAFGDRAPQATLIAMLIGVGASMAAVSIWGNGFVAAMILLALWSVSFGGIPAIMHARILHTASLRLRDIGAAWLTTAFNVAIAVGALVGGLLLDEVGIEVLPWAAVLLFVGALVFVLLTDRIRLAPHSGEQRSVA